MVPPLGRYFNGATRNALIASGHLNGVHGKYPAGQAPSGILFLTRPESLSGKCAKAARLWWFLNTTPVGRRNSLEVPPT
jgi:hypothetical protein